MKNTLVIDLDRCSGCDSCVAACKMENQMNLGVVRNHVSAIGPTGTFPDIEMYWLPMQCQQCENPGCIEVCPTGASYRDEETGIVLVNAEDCIGCESCLTGCPYGVRQLNPKTNTIEQAIERAGTKAGNKGYDCALSAVEMVNLLREIGD